MKKKLTSRKFLMALSGVITGIFLIISGDTVEGATTVMSSIVSYCIAEGYVDAQVSGEASAGGESPLTISRR